MMLVHVWIIWGLKLMEQGYGILFANGMLQQKDM